MQRLIAFVLIAVHCLAVADGGVRLIDSPAAAGSLAPALAPLGDGRVVLSWLETRGDGHALQFSIYDDAAFGEPGTIASGRDWFANWADTPGVFPLPGGDWIAHWLVKSGPSTYAYDVMMARSGDGGASWSVPFRPHADDTQSEHGFVSYFADSGQRAGIVWLDGRATAGHGEGAMALRTATVGPEGEISARHLLDERVCDCCQTAAAMTDEGPVVVYRDRSEDEIRDHYVVRRTAEGWSEPERLHADNWHIAACPVNGPAMVADGRLVAIAWFTMGGGEPRVELAVSADSGVNFRHVDTLDAGTALGRVDLAVSDGGFVLTWIDSPAGKGLLRIAGYGWDGRQRWRREAASIDAGRASGFPRLAVIDSNRLLVAWTGARDGERRVRVAVLTLPRGNEQEQVDRGGPSP